MAQQFAILGQQDLAHLPINDDFLFQLSHIRGEVFQHGLHDVFFAHVANQYVPAVNPGVIGG